MVMMKIHPLCAASADMPADDWAAFFESVKEFGVLIPVSTYHGEVVAGRHRAKAAHIAGKPCPSKEIILPDKMPIEQWIAEEAKRKHFGKNELILQAAAYKDVVSRWLREKEAARKSKDEVTPGNSSESLSGDARDIAGQKFGVSGDSVDAGEKILKQGIPSLQEMARSGQVSVSAAAEVATMHPERQEAIVADGPEAVKKSAAGSRKAKASKTKSKEEKKPEPERAEVASPIDKMAAQARSVSAFDGLGVIEKAHSKEDFIAAMVAKASEHGLVVMPKDQPNPQSVQLANPLDAVVSIFDTADEQTQRDIRDYVGGNMQDSLHPEVAVETLAGLSDRPIDVVRLVYQQAAETEKAAIVKLVRGLERTEKAVKEATNPRPKKEFAPPTLDEVRRYCEAEGKNVDPEQFHAYYATNGWKQKSGRPIQDWKAAIVTWVKNNERFGRPATPFKPPTIEEAKTYFSEKSLDGDATHFHAHHTANGWKQGSGQPIQNWKAAAVTWAKSQIRFASEKDKKAAEQEEEGRRMRAQTDAFLKKIKEHVG